MRTGSKSKSQAARHGRVGGFRCPAGRKHPTCRSVDPFPACQGTTRSVEIAASLLPRSRLPNRLARRAFTLIELLLVMTIVVATIAVAGPTLANFFRGRTLDSEARRLLALTHSGQSRAVNEGIPTRLWLDIPQHTYGLEQDPGWSDRDPKALEFSFDNDLQIEVVHANSPRSTSRSRPLPPSSQAKANPRNLPEIRFLPDGSVDENSPLAVHLQDRSGTSLWLAQATNHLSYEIRDSFK